MKYGKLSLGLGAILFSMNALAGAPVRNPNLAAEKYAITHFDSSQSDNMPYPITQGTFQADVLSNPRVTSGPVNIMTFATPSPDFMWSVSSQGVAYIDVTNNGFKELASMNVPGVKAFSDEELTKGLGKTFKKSADAKKVVKDWGLDWTRIGNGIYSFVDKDNKLYYNTYDRKVYVFGLKNPKNPAEGIQVLSSKDFSPMLGKKEAVAGLSVTYDGKLVVLGNNTLLVMNMDLQGDPQIFKFQPDEYVSNSMAIDEKNGIYVASDKFMRKLVWNGTSISTSEKDGAWMAAYDSGKEPPSVKVGKGTGSTPTLMGFGEDQDKLVVITDGSDKMKLVAFWRDQIPQDFKPIAGAKSNRIAGQVDVTCGLNPAPKFIQTEQSVVVKGYGAFVVNNIREKGDKDRMVDVLAGGPVFTPGKGVERFEWNPQSNSWSSVWNRNDVVSTSMVPAVSEKSNIVVVNGYTKQDGWEVTGMDWDSGKTVHRIVFGQSNFGNGAYAILQYMPNGDLLFNSIGGVTRIPYASEKVKQAEEAKE